MKNFIYIYLFILVGCESKKEIVTVESRELIVFESKNLVRNNPIELTKTENDSLIKYWYRNLVDSTKSMSFQYLKNQDKICFAVEQFHLKEKKYLSEETIFDIYETEPIVDGMGPLLFNKDYGILAFENGWGMEFHFLTKEYKAKLNLPIQLNSSK